MKNIELSVRQAAVINSQTVLDAAPYWQVAEAERVLEFNRAMLAGLEAKLAQPSCKH